MDSKLVHQSVSIGDVATAAGVSRSTVSNYLNGRAGKISPSTWERLGRVIDHLGYRPMLGARRLSSRSQSGSVGLLVRKDLATAFSEPYFAEVMAGLGPALGSLGLRSLVVCPPAPGGDDTDYVLSMARGIVDGFLVFNIQEEDRTIEALVRHQVPFVAVGQPDRDVTYPWVATDHAGAVFEAVRWLAGRGHRSIALEPGAKNLWLTRHRRRGYLEGLNKVGLSADPENPTAALVTFGSQTQVSFAAKVELVLVDTFSGRHPGPWDLGRIESPAAEVGRRAAILLQDRIGGGSPRPELLSAKFIPRSNQ